MLHIDDLRTLLVVFALALTFIWLKKKGSSIAPRRPLPPGPWRWPILGSVSVIPAVISDVKRHQLRTVLAEKYGKILSFKIGSLNVVWLNDMETIKEAFVTKGEVMSDRMSSDSKSFFAISGDLAKYSGLGIGETNYGKAFKERKRLALQSMKEFGFGGVSLEDRVVEEARLLVEELKKAATSPSKDANKRSTGVHNHVVHLAVSNVICSVVFGRRFDYADEKFVSVVDAIRFLFSGQKSSVITKIPFARYLPAVQRLMEKESRAAASLQTFIEEQIQAHESDFDPGEDPKDFIDICLLKAHLEAENARNGVVQSDENSVGTENVKKIIADLFFAGTDTTASSLSWFILFMIHYPEIQKRCHEEVDRWIGDGNPVELTKDNVVKSLPYTAATLLEVQRVASIASASLPHFVREDVTIAGYHVPKDSFVLANIRFVHFDERNWERPHEFDPTRWLKWPVCDTAGDGATTPHLIQHPHFIPFSIGKRRCLGENLAKAEYLIFGVSLLKEFRFCAEENAVLPSLEGRGLIYGPQPFELVLERRNCTDG